MDRHEIDPVRSVTDAKARLLNWASAKDAEPKTALFRLMPALGLVGAGLIGGRLLFKGARNKDGRGKLGTVMMLAKTASWIAPIALKMLANHKSNSSTQRRS